MSNELGERLTKRKCRWCGATYRAPVHSKADGCQECCPRIVSTFPGPVVKPTPGQLTVDDAA